MHPVIQKTFGGLSPQYYFRQLFFGLLISSFVFVMALRGKQGIPFVMLFIVVVNTFLYPYSRFVYESVVGFIIGNNVFFVNAIFMLITKCFTMIMCWSFALFIAPVGLAYLYFHNNKTNN